MIGIHPDNQVPELKDYNLFSSDPALQRAVRHGQADWRAAELRRQGAEYGSEATLRAAEDANRYPPELHTHSATGQRIDFVKFHPGWHTMMAMARRNGNANLPYLDPRPSAWSAYGASMYLHSQIESGSGCPTTMTKACIPVVALNPALYAELAPKLLSLEHDPRDLPLAQKTSITIGMGMTEKQGGSDVRSNTTRAVPVGSGPWGDGFLLTGHKWFFSAPMCDGHLVLAKTDEHGATCFFVPRWGPDGRKNPIHIQRLKDKVGNRSNASSEVEFKEAYGVRVGTEGRGIRTLIEMANYTRLDCALSSAGYLRQGLVQALHWARNRFAFGRLLAEQAAMQTLLADMALESEAATVLAMDLAARFGSDAPSDLAWRRLLTPAAKFWNCKRAVGYCGEAMEVLGGNGYVEAGPLGRLFREAPVNSIWEGSGNVMCLDVLRAVAHAPDDAHAVLDHLQAVARQAPEVLRQVQQLRAALRQPPEELEAQARRFTQRLVLTAQACLMLQQASPLAAEAFIASRFDPDWGPVMGIAAGTPQTAALLQAAWA
ncbi:acyl-CoA dehydrogenase family protein [Curvibacter sp. HBC61]|uniref:Acyl-CoA dehydrogenase family protein n=1 Tax=Curvibacter cyanobacteriorum TaxID=3026422 RepID=A0ABT5N1P5_9BURK|nr:acyl-CoA dehydrogenase family protein [Curvibacter sp. HBC61]MDD0839436.1 acyl-CoA dehydrogenase family protein [Curvibacter sp. HBC61]